MSAMIMIMPKLAPTTAAVISPTWFPSPLGLWETRGGASVMVVGPESSLATDTGE